MHLNDDFSRRVVIDTTALPWQASPGGHVERRMLDRTGAELARATSIVRYAPQSVFPRHTHGGGEEFLVLSGTFSDEHGDCPAGFYVRNPVGSGHTPASVPGCTIYVKLWWMRAEDQSYVRTDGNDPGLWRAGDAPGITVVPLHRFGAEETMMLRLEPGAVIPERAIAGGEEILVLSGACQDADGGYAPALWSRRPPGHAPALSSATGCRLFVKRGHLADPPPPPA